MTPQEANKAIIAAVRRLLAKHGFRRRKIAWYRHDRQFLQMIDVQTGQQAIIVKLGAMYRPLNRTTHPAPNDCHISIGLGSVVSPAIDWRFIRAYRNWISPNDDRIKEFVNVIEEIVMPVLDRWRSEESIRDFLETPLGARSNVSHELTQYLAQ
jgi:hypothetical protein